MEKIVGKMFRNERVSLDFSEYEKCSFINCEIHVEYGIFRLVNNDFSNCKLNLHGPARNIAELINLFTPKGQPLKLIKED